MKSGLSSTRGHRERSEVVLPRSIRATIEALEIRRLFSAGEIDPTFGDGGRVFGLNGETRPGRYVDLQVQRDGKTLALAEQWGQQETGFVVARFNTDGSTDPTFGVNGVAAIPVATQNTNDALLLLANGKIVAVGHGSFASNDGPTYYIRLARFNADGSADQTFGDHGLAVNAYRQPLVCSAVTMQPDGKFLITCADLSDGNRAFLLTRFNADGSLDASFGTDGLVSADFTPGEDQAVESFVGADGRIVVVGSASSDGESYQGAALRLNADGSPDSTFGFSGRRTFTGLLDNIAQAERTIDGKFLLANSSGDMVRFNADWTLDTSFGTNGYAFNHNAGYISDLWLQPDGRILQSGVARTVPAPFVTRYNYDGTLDSTFDANASSLYDRTLFSNKAQCACAVASDAEGRIVLAGYVEDYGNLAMWRVDPGPFAVDAFGVLHVNGTEGNDQVYLKRDGEYLLATVNRLTARVRPAGLRGILVRANGGDDLVVVSPGVMGTQIAGGAGNDSLVGGDGSDSIIGNSGKDRISGGAGNDRLAGSGGNDAITGGPGLDRVYGENGNDRVEAGAGADRIWGGDGSDLLAGGSGNDGMWGGDGNNTLVGGRGADRLYYVSRDDTVYLNATASTYRDDGSELLTIIESVQES